MASEQAILNIMGRALWDPIPTAGSDLRARQLAAALGYPKTWRVVRTIEDAPVPAPAAVAVAAHVVVVLNNHNDSDNKGNEKDGAKGKDTLVSTDAKKMETIETTTAKEKAAVDATTTITTNDKDAPPNKDISDMATTESQDDKAQTDATSKEDAGEQDPKAIISCSNDLDGKKDDDKMEIDEETATVAVKGNESVIDDTPETSKEAAKIDASRNDTSNINNDKNNEANAQQTHKEGTTEAKATDDDNKKVPASTTSTIKETTTTLVESNNEVVPATNTSSTPAEEPPQPTTTPPPKKTIAKVIVDRIYAGKPGTDCDMWFNHYAAMQAAQQWDALIISSNNSEAAAASTSPTTKLQMQMPTPFHFKGGHLLPRVSKFEKNDKVEVYFENKWWDAKILRKKEHVIDGFRYQVQYNVDNSKQSGVDENLIRHRTVTAKDPHDVATLLGFDAGWQAVSTGHNRWKITSPSGVTYQSKRAALKAAKEQVTKAMEVGDPPWRTTGHDYIGRLVLYTQEHAVSARRKIKVQQTGKVVGWISATDVDQAGQPGFVSESTGKPANLFHVEFDDTISSPQHHPYPSYLVQSQDLEEFEVEACLISIPDEQKDVVVSPSKKRARTKR